MFLKSGNICIRLSVADGEKVRKELKLTGETGEKALRKIQEATKPASTSLSAINIIAEQAHYGMLHLAGGAGVLGLNLSRLGPLGVAAAATLGTFFSAVQSGVKELNEADKALHQLQAALTATDYASGVTAREIGALGEILERTTLFKKEDVERAAANLTSFGNIQDKIFTRAIKLLTDLSVRLGVDLPSAADMLGKVLEKPEEGLGRLGRKVSDLTVAQKESIDTLVKQGDAASAQAIILQHLESKVHGLAEAQNKGLTGAANRASDAWGNFLESLGRTELAQKSINALTQSMHWLSDVIDPKLTDKVAKLKEEITNIENAIDSKAYNVLNRSDPSLARKKQELADLQAQIAAEEAKTAEEKTEALEKAREATVVRRHNQMMELSRKYAKEHESTWSTQQKALSDYAEKYREIINLGREGGHDKYMREALENLDISTRLKLKGMKTNDAQTPYAAAQRALDEWREGVLNNLSEAGGAHKQYVEMIEDLHKNRSREAYMQSLADSTNWADGIKLAWYKYVDETMNAARLSEQAFTKAAHGIEDSLTNAVMHGEFSLRKLGEMVMSIEADIMRAFIRQNVVSPLMGAASNFMSGMFGGVFHEGGVVGQTAVPQRLFPSDFFTTAPRFHSGLRADEFPAILQRGEIVIPKSAAQKAHAQEYQSGGINITINVSTPNAQSFMESRGQMMATLAGEIDRYRSRNR